MDMHDRIAYFIKDGYQILEIGEPQLETGNPPGFKTGGICMLFELGQKNPGYPTEYSRVNISPDCISRVVAEQDTLPKTLGPILGILFRNIQKCFDARDSLHIGDSDTNTACQISNLIQFDFGQISREANISASKATNMQQTAALSPKEGEIASQAEARRDSAQEPTGETARLKSRNGNTGGELTWGRRLGPIICPEKTASKTPGEFPEDIEVDRVKGPVVPKSISRPAKKNRRRRANRRFKEALHQNFTKEEKDDGEAVATPKIRAVQDSEGFLNSTNHASVNECVKQTTVSQTDTELPKWLRSTAQLIQMESTWGKQHEFYYGEELDAHEKIYCVLHSIDDSCLSHDGLERPVYPESWHEWEHLSSPCKGLGKIHQRAPKVKIHKIMYHGVDAEPATFYQTVDEHSNYHTFTADGTPVHTAQMLEWHERDFNQRCKSLTDFEALVNEQEVLIADSCGIKYGPDGNPIAETLSNLKYGGVVFRGKPRLVHSHVLLPNGRDNCGNIIRKYGYTKTLLAYKSFYRVMSTSNKEIYHFGGEQLFYKSGQPCAHLYGNPEPDANIFEELVYL